VAPEQAEEVLGGLLRETDREDFHGRPYPFFFFGGASLGAVAFGPIVSHSSEVATPYSASTTWAMRAGSCFPLIVPTMRKLPDTASPAPGKRTTIPLPSATTSAVTPLGRPTAAISTSPLKPLRRSTVTAMSSGWPGTRAKRSAATFREKSGSANSARNRY